MNEVDVFWTAIIGWFLAACSPLHRYVEQFTGPDAVLEQAIEVDDPRAVEKALAAGANVNARGAHNVTPLSFAVGTFRRRAAEALVRARADPNLKDAGGQNAVSMAVIAYSRDPSLLRLVLDAGGDPNTKRPDGDPVLVRFLTDANLDAISFMHARGADIDANFAGDPMVVSTALAGDWDVAWHLIQLGARLDTPDVREGLPFTFNTATVPQPDGPLFPYKVKVWRRLKELGIEATPPVGM